VTLTSIPEKVAGSGPTYTFFTSGLPEAGGGVVVPGASVVVAPAGGTVVTGVGSVELLPKAAMTVTTKGPGAVKAGAVNVTPLLGPATVRPLTSSCKPVGVAPEMVALAVQLEPAGFVVLGSTSERATWLLPPEAVKFTDLASVPPAANVPVQARSTFVDNVAAGVPKTTSTTSTGDVVRWAGGLVVVALVVVAAVERLTHLYDEPDFEHTRAPDTLPDWLFVQVPPTFGVEALAATVGTVSATANDTLPINAAAERREFMDVLLRGKLASRLPFWATEAGYPQVRSVVAAGDPSIRPRDRLSSPTLCDLYPRALRTVTEIE
jgi:hypothetical protein